MKRIVITDAVKQRPRCVDGFKYVFKKVYIVLLHDTWCKDIVH